MSAQDGLNATGGFFVGRAAEVGELGAVVRGVAAAGHGRAVLVSGEAGIGKSALVEEIATLARRSGLAVHWARCIELGSAPAYWPWTQFLVDMVTPQLWAELGDSARYAVAVLAPKMATGTASYESAELDRDDNLFRLFDGVLRVLEGASKARRRCYVMEDCHAADAASVQLLRFVLGHTGPQSQYLFVATHRDDGSSRSTSTALADLGSSVTRIALQGLTTEDLRHVAAAVTGDPPSAEVAAALHEATGGNPLFAKTLARELAAKGQLASVGEASTIHVPGSLRTLFARRFDPLGSAVTEQLAMLSAAGRNIDPALGRRLLGDEFEPVVTLGLAASLLERTAEGGLRFAHSLVQAALLDSLTVSTRQALELQVAAGIEELYEGDLSSRLAALSQHFSLAGPGAAHKAFTYGRAAGDQARRVGAPEDAARHYSRALDAAPLAGVTAAERAAVLAARGHARVRSGDVDGGQLECREAWEIARRAGAATVMGEAALAYATLIVGGVVSHEAVRLLSGALADIGTADRGLRARLRARLAAEVAFSAPTETLESLTSEAIAEARETGDPFVLFSTLRFAEGAIATPENVHTCLDLMSEALAAAEAMGDLAAKADAHAFRSVHNLVLGDPDAYGADVGALAQLAELVPTRGNQWHVTVAAGCRALLDGRFDDAAAVIASSLGFASTVPNAIVNWHFQDFSLEWERGDIARFEPIVTMLSEIHPGASPMLRSALALVQATAGRSEEARAILVHLAPEVIARRQPRLFLLSLGWLAETAWMIGERGAGELLYDALRPYGDLHIVGQTGAAAAYWGSVSRHLANLSLLLGDVEAAVRHGERAVAAHARVGSVPFLARSQHELGRALVARGRQKGSRGDLDRAHALMQEADATATRLGMSAFLEVGSQVQDAPLRVTADPDPTGPRLVREGDYWTLAHGESVVRLRHTKGVQYLAALLRAPGVEAHALDLTSPSGGSRLDDSGGDLQLDSQARGAYRDRLRDLEQEIIEAEDDADLGRTTRLRVEWDFLVDELTRATGLGGVPRRLGSSSSEAARVAVTKGIRSVLKKIDAAAPELGRHLRATIRTGTYCTYSSDLEPCLQWEVIGI